MKEGPLELWRKRANICAMREEREESHGSTQWKSFILRAFNWRSQGIVSIVRYQGRGSLVIAADPGVSHGAVPPGLAAFLGLELNNQGLDVIFRA